jgi:hypothetical protein
MKGIKRSNPIIKPKMSCSGCFPMYQHNQLAHVTPGGCLHDSSFDEFCQPISLTELLDCENDADSVWETDSESDERIEATEPIAQERAPSQATEAEDCCICFETIGEKNTCVTECGHKFCLKCLMTAMTRNNACPMCRTKLIDEQDDSDNEEEEEDEAEDDYDEEEVNERESDDPDVEEYVDRFEKAGLTMMDVVSLWLGQFSKKNAKYTDDYIEKLGADVTQIMEDVEREHDERLQMEEADQMRPVDNVVQEQ